MKREYTTKEIAITLNEIGFNTEGKKYSVLRVLSGDDFSTISISAFLSLIKAGVNVIVVPLWQEAIDFFRDKYNIEIEVFRTMTDEDGNNYGCQVIKWSDNETDEIGNDYRKTHPEAREFGILTAINDVKNILKKNNGK